MIDCSNYKNDDNNLFRIISKDEEYKRKMVKYETKLIKGIFDNENQVEYYKSKMIDLTNKIMHNYLNQ